MTHPDPAYTAWRDAIAERHQATGRQSDDRPDPYRREGRGAPALRGTHATVRLDRPLHLPAEHVPTRGRRPVTCGVEFVKWFWTGPWLVTCRQPEGHDGEHHDVPDAPLPSGEGQPRVIPPVPCEKCGGVWAHDADCPFLSARRGQP